MPPLREPRPHPQENISASSAWPAEETNRVTVGTVQREVRMGTSAAEVAEVLGSPNIVMTDDQRTETWIYDKISTDVSYRSVAATPQDLGFTIDQADAELGTITATRFHECTMRSTKLCS